MSDIGNAELRSEFSSDEQMMMFLIQVQYEEYFDRFRLAAANRQLPQSILDHLLVFSNNEYESKMWLNYGADPTANGSVCILGPAEWAELDQIKLLVTAGAKPTMIHVEAATYNNDSNVAHFLLDTYMEDNSKWYSPQSNLLLTQTPNSLNSRKRQRTDMNE